MGPGNCKADDRNRKGVVKTEKGGKRKK